MKKIAIFGAGGFGREVAMLIEQINDHSPEWQFVGFFDDEKQKGEIINDYIVLGNTDDLNNYQEEIHVVFAIGDPVIKKNIFSRIKSKFVLYPILVHPNVLCGNKKVISIGEGAIICASNIITVNIKIGKHVIVNLGCTIGHDVVIEDFASLMPNVNISGDVNIGEAVYIGSGATIINQMEIGANTIIGAGAVVSKSLPANCTAVGVPAKPIKFHV